MLYMFRGMNHYFIIKFLFLWFVTLFNILKFDEKNNIIIKNVDKFYYIKKKFKIIYEKCFCILFSEKYLLN